MQLDGFQDVSGLLRAGIYALCRRGVVIYVGKSKSLYSRIYTHRNLTSRGKGKKVPTWMPQTLRGIAFDEVFIQPCRLEDLDAVEERMINLYKPHYNINLKNNLKVRAPITLNIGGAMIQMNAAPRPQIGFRR